MAWSPAVNLSRLLWQSNSIFLCLAATKSSWTLMCRSIWTHGKRWWASAMSVFCWDSLRQLCRYQSFCERWFAAFLCSSQVHSEMISGNVWNLMNHSNRSECSHTWNRARILSIPQSGVFKLSSASSESESLECVKRCFSTAAFLSLVPNPDMSSASMPEGVRWCLSKSLLGLTSLSSSLSEMIKDFLRWKLH